MDNTKLEQTLKDRDELKHIKELMACFYGFNLTNKEIQETDMLEPSVIIEKIYDRTTEHTKAIFNEVLYPKMFELYQSIEEQYIEKRDAYDKLEIIEKEDEEPEPTPEPKEPEEPETPDEQ